MRTAPVYTIAEHGGESVFRVCACHRVPNEQEQWPIIAHADVGGGDCDGCIFPVVSGDQAEITSNSCGAVIRTVPVADLQRIYDEDEIELGLDATATEMCPHCGKVNIFPGWSSMMAYTCRGCGPGGAAANSANSVWLVKVSTGGTGAISWPGSRKQMTGMRRTLELAETTGDSLRVRSTLAFHH